MRLATTLKDGSRYASFAWTALAYLLLACLAYLPILIHGDFLCDDFILLARIKSGINIWDYRGADFYRPAICTTLSGLWKLFGTNPFPYHLFNILVLVATGLLLRAIWLRLVPSRPRSAFVVGLAFVLWIPHSESVDWISGMTDGVSVLFGAAAVLAFIRYRERPTLWAFLLAAVLLWIGFLGKEAIVSWALILPVLGLLVSRPGTSWIQRAGEAAILCALGAVFVGWRGHVIGKLIGGYGAKVHLDIRWQPISAKLSRHMAMDFLPFNKTLAILVGPGWAVIATTVVCVGIPALLLRKIPKKAPTPEWVQAMVALLTLVAYVRLAYIYVPDVLWEEHTPALYMVGGILIALVVCIFVRTKKRPRFDTPLAFVLLSLVAVLIHANTIDKQQEWLLFAVYLWFAFATRPVAELSEPDRRLALVAVAFFASTFLATLPTATLKIGFTGEASRFTYGPSFFSGVALLAVLLLYINRSVIRNGSAAVGLIALGALLYLNNVPWAQASELSRQTTAAIRSVLPARRVYVLTAPGALSAAFLFRIGIDSLPDLTLDDRKVSVRPANYIIGCVDDDRIDVLQTGPASYSLRVIDSRSSLRFENAYLEKVEDNLQAGWYTFADETRGTEVTPVVNLVGFQPKTDHVIVIDGTSARVIR